MINIFLLNWNNSDDTISCIRQIFKSSYKIYRIILIDNNSDESERNRLISLLKEIKTYSENELHIVLNSENLGYAGGNNKGYEYLKENNFDGDVLIINTDILISENTLEELKLALETDKMAGAVMCRTVNVNKEIIYDYISMNGLNQRWLLTDKDLVETDYVAGSCMLLKRDVIDKIGLFNDNFFMYWEEVDLSFRIREHGYKLLSTTKTLIIRKENSKSRSYNMNFYMTRNLFLIKKLHSNISLQSFMFALVKRFVESLIISYKYKDLNYVLFFLKGVFHGFKSII